MLLDSQPGMPRRTMAVRIGWVATTRTRARKTGPTISDRARMPETTRKAAASPSRTTMRRGSSGLCAGAGDAELIPASGAAAYEQVGAPRGGRELRVVVLVDA